jgi:glycosyltransferase involved in cell wall biosynthesis
LNVTRSDRQPARIGVDVTSAIVQGAGIGRYTRELINAIVAIDSDNQYRLFTAKPPTATPVANPLPQAANVTFKPAPIGERWLYRLWYRARLPLPVQWVTGGLDLFHSPDFVLPPVSGNIPTLLTVHDLSFVHYANTFDKRLVDYLNRVVPWSVKRATHILADSQATQDDLVALWNVNPDKISVLYSGVADRFRPITYSDQLSAMRQRYDLGDSPYLLCVGTVQPRKNYQMLIRAYATIARDWPHNLVIAGGKGWLFDEILAEVERNNLSDRVRFIGFVDEADLPALYSDATLFLFPSLYEGFGLPLLEAMACGVPVVSSDASCLPEVVGDAGVLLSPHDAAAWSAAIHRLLLDTPRRVKLIGAGAIQARRFSWRKSAYRLRKIYTRLLEGSAVN